MFGLATWSCLTSMSALRAEEYQGPAERGCCFESLLAGASPLRLKTETNFLI